jgi:hypothetical protein
MPLKAAHKVTKEPLKKKKVRACFPLWNNKHELYTNLLALMATDPSEANWRSKAPKFQKLFFTASKVRPKEAPLMCCKKSLWNKGCSEQQDELLQIKILGNLLHRFLNLGFHAVISRVDFLALAFGFGPGFNLQDFLECDGHAQ